MNITHCCECEKLRNAIQEELKIYTPDFYKHFTGTTEERMYHAGRRSVLTELWKGVGNDATIRM